MEVTVSNWAWFDKKDFSTVKLEILKEKLTIVPKATSIHQTEIKPLHMYTEKDGMFGVPREFFMTQRQLHHRVKFDMSDGVPVDVNFKGELIEDQGRAVKTVYNDFQSKGTGSIIQASPGWGKGNPYDTPILTDNGWIKIGDAKVGTKVFGSDGKLHNITGVYHRGSLPTYRVSFTDKTFVDCDGDHLWTFEMRRKKGKPFETIKTDDLIREKLREGHGVDSLRHRRFYLPMVKPIEYLNCENLLIDPYTLGVILGDGSVSIKNRVEITIPDQDSEIVSQLVFPADTDVVKFEYPGKCPGYRINGSFLTFYSLFEKYGLSGRVSHDKFIPEAYLRASVEDRLAILQGLMDTDGTVNGSSPRFSTVSKGLCDGVKDLVGSLGGTCSVGERYTDCQTSRRHHSYRLEVKLPIGMNCFRLRRKAEKANVPRQREPYRAVDSVKSIGCSDIVCISVNSSDSLYVTKDHILTHNTVCALGLWVKFGVSCIVVVQKSFLLEQWKKRIQQFVPDARIGIIQQDRCEFGEGYDISIAMVQSLANRRDVYPEELWSWPGLVITDETHRFGAKTWASVVPLFTGRYRVGLSATLRRKDGADNTFFWHIGKVLYKSKVKRLTPKLRRVFTGFEFRVTPKSDPNDFPDSVKLKFLCGNPKRNALIVDELVKAASVGRKILVLSERRKHLEKLRDLFAPKKDENCIVDFYVGGRTTAELDIAEKADVVLGTYQMAKEALDIPKLDTAFFVSPISDVEQAAGRIMRPSPGKRDPIIVDFIDSEVRSYARKWNARLRFYRQNGMFIQGEEK